MVSLVVHHWIACQAAQFQQSQQWLLPYNLLGVSFTHTVPTGTAYPDVLNRLDVFARFYHARDARV